ncbi:hypothetical protein NEMBOFW57_008281 [Staphylotrichum longicolle]|uniref:Metallo-beta-lactamase domain-containing protein n=1 Tax=Staphylotrichum longicolle TaxID=669026 RepID=A0AAD4ERE1_9PEZI|nr:hypothetical protein NEMBOFW57_008281 [Staphylotrichum longicolle]
MDAASLTAIYQSSKDSVRFFVPLNNKRYLLSFDIPPDRIVEMDWWDSVQLTHPSSPGTILKIHCTPAQHNSFRAANDTNTALWSSWYLEHLRPSHPAFRVFFAGDGGYQFHPSPSWPPPPPSSVQNQYTTTDNATATTNSHNSDDEASEYPPCPAFRQIRTRLGAPHLLLLPVSVGATYAYLRSFVPLPDWCNPFPRHSEGVTGANHMGPWDAVRVLRVMTDARRDEEDGAVAIVGRRTYEKGLSEEELCL